MKLFRVFSSDWKLEGNVTQTTDSDLQYNKNKQQRKLELNTPNHTNLKKFQTHTNLFIY